MKRSSMKRMITFLVILAVMTTPIVQVYADSGVQTSSVGSYAAIGEEVVRNAYEASVIGRLAGRCGVTPDGTKGLVFEILCKDKMNLENLFNKVFTPRLAYSPNGVRADIVAVNSTGHNIGYFQCKDVLSRSGIRDTYQRVKEGQYRFTRLLGTKESAEAFNTYASNKGMVQQMQNSGISSNTTSRIAEKSLGTLSIRNAASVGLNAGLIGAGINNAVALVECLINQKDFCDSFGHVTVQTIKGFATAASSGFIVEITGAAIAAAGGGAVTMVLISTAVATGTGILSCYVLDKLIAQTDIEKTIAELTKEFGESVAECVRKFKIKTVSAYNGIKDTAVQVGGKIKDAANKFGETIKDTADKVGEKIKDTSVQGGKAIKETAYDAKKYIEDTTGNIGSAASNTALKVKDSVAALVNQGYTSLENLFRRSAPVPAD